VKQGQGLFAAHGFFQGTSGRNGDIGAVQKGGDLQAGQGVVDAHLAAFG
jgi:hypothetical protein